MGATDLIERLALAGVTLTALDSDRLSAEPSEALTDELRNLIRANKAELIAMLAAPASVEPDDPLDHEQADRERFEERAAICEFDDGLPRDDAELMAAWEVTQARFQRLTAREWLARFAPERLPAGDSPDNYPVAQIKPGSDFWLERQRRGGT